jgi:hypothetical protein
MTESKRVWPNALSRRSLLSGVGATAICSAITTSGEAKVSQSAVTYQGTPKGEQRCGTCKQFEPPNACRLIDGKISPQGWCKLWAKA